MPSSRGSSLDHTHICYVSCIDRQVGFFFLVVCFFLPLVPPGKVSSAGCTGSTPGPGTKILHAVWYGQKF